MPKLVSASCGGGLKIQGIGEDSCGAGYRGGQRPMDILGRCGAKLLHPSACLGVGAQILDTDTDGGTGDAGGAYPSKECGIPRGRFPMETWFRIRAMAV
jgi:hypothetical protein